MTDVIDNLRMLEKRDDDYRLIPWATAEAARKEIEQLRAALDELIACNESPVPAFDEGIQKQSDYYNRIVLAWAEARRLRGKE